MPFLAEKVTNMLFNLIKKGTGASDVGEVDIDL
jgi:hypothetical protein